MSAPEPNLEILVSRINDRLEELGLSARAALRSVGLPDHTISNIRKRRMPAADRLELIANALQCTSAYLLGKTDKTHGIVLDLKILRPAGPSALNGATVHSLLDQLDEIDRLSIRAIREFLITLPDTPDRLHSLDAAAANARQQIHSRITGTR